MRIFAVLLLSSPAPLAVLNKGRLGRAHWVGLLSSVTAGKIY